MAATSEPGPGDLIAGRYEVLRLLGRGGMGSVWAASDREQAGQVAIKFLDAPGNASSEVLSRFAREAEAAERINSPYVTRVLDHGLDDARGPYLVMELLEGEDLGKRLQRDGRLPLRDVGNMVVQCCRALEQAHAAGIVHRDIKPENFFLCKTDKDIVIKLLDFGVAKVAREEQARQLTSPGELLGTLEYMSPEHVMMRGTVDARADLYSLAVVAYRAITGAVPFPSDGIGELILALATREAEPPSSVREDVSGELDAWFACALQRDPSERFQSARGMAEAFVAAFRGRASMLPLGAADARAPGPASDKRGAASSRTGAVATTEAPARPPAAEIAPPSRPSASLVMSPRPESPSAPEPPPGVPTHESLPPAMHRDVKLAIAAGVVLTLLAIVAWALG